MGADVAGGHRVKTASGGGSRRAKGRHRAKQTTRATNGWLGAGALTLGLGAALASGTGVAHADGTTADGTSSSSASSSANSSSSPGASSGTSSVSSAPQSAETPSASTSRPSASTATSHARPSTGTPHGRSPRSTVQDADTDAKPRGGPTRPPVAAESNTPSSASTATAQSDPADDDDGTPVSSTPPVAPTSPAPSDATPFVGSPIVGAPSPLARHAMADVRAAVHAVVDGDGHGSATGSPRSGVALASAQAPTSTAAVALRPAVTASATTPVAAAPAPVAAVIPAGPLVVPPLPADPVTGLLVQVFSALNTLISPNPAVPPSNPLHLLVFEVVRRFEMIFGLPVVGTIPVRTSDPVIGTNPVSTVSGTPEPGDTVQTPYGAIGKWELQPNGQISNFGGEILDGRPVLEPVNLIILDPTSTSSAQAVAKLNAQFGAAGFPAQPVHSTGFQGVIDGVTYGQQPAGLLEGFSDNFFLLPDDHARAFGPDPDPNPSGAGYVWTVAASREQFGINGLLPTHVYVSYNAARDALASRLVLSGATLVGIVPLNNALDDATGSTGDHDGYAIVIQLND
jgi:hypothetical protein